MPLKERTIVDVREEMALLALKDQPGHEWKGSTWAFTEGKSVSMSRLGSA